MERAQGDWLYETFKSFEVSGGENEKYEAQREFERMYRHIADGNKLTVNEKSSFVVASLMENMSTFRQIQEQLDSIGSLRSVLARTTEMLDSIDKLFRTTDEPFIIRGGKRLRGGRTNGKGVNTYISEQYREADRVTMRLSLSTNSVSTQTYSEHGMPMRMPPDQMYRLSNRGAARYNIVGAEGGVVESVLPEPSYDQVHFAVGEESCQRLLEQLSEDYGVEISLHSDHIREEYINSPLL